MTKLKTSAPPLSLDTADSKHDFVQQLASAWHPKNWIDFPIVLAVSGGSDSIALLHGVKELRDRFEQSDAYSKDKSPSQHKNQASENRLLVGHFNHGMREGEATADARFVQSICEKLKLPCEIGQVEQTSMQKTPREGWESTCRNMRYAFLLKLAEKHGARYVVTGHTADDQVETILHRVIRGTGLRGLTGMPRSRSLSPAVSLLRPMLGLSRSMARDYLESLEIEWKNDSTNASAAFTRNRIRHDLLPLLERDFNPQVSTAVLRLSQLAGEAQEMVDGVIANTLAACRSLEKNGEIVLKLGELVAQPEFLIRELMIAIWRERGWPLQAMGLREWQSLAELLREADPGVLTLPGSVVAKKEGGKLSLHRPQINS